MDKDFHVKCVIENGVFTCYEIVDGKRVPLSKEDEELFAGMCQHAMIVEELLESDSNKPV